MEHVLQGQAEQLVSLQDAQRSAKLQMDQYVTDIQVRWCCLCQGASALKRTS